MGTPAALQASNSDSPSTTSIGKSLVFPEASVNLTVYVATNQVKTVGLQAKKRLGTRITDLERRRCMGNKDTCQKYKTVEAQSGVSVDSSRS